MQPLLLALITLMAIFWLVAIPLLRSCNDREGWFVRIMDNAWAGNLFMAALVVLGFTIGGIGLYADVSYSVMAYGGQLWTDGHRLTCVVLTSAYFSTFTLASFMAIGISGFLLVEFVKDIISACTGQPREQVVG